MLLGQPAAAIEGRQFRQEAEAAEFAGPAADGSPAACCACFHGEVGTLPFFDLLGP